MKVQLAKLTFTVVVMLSLSAAATTEGDVLIYKDGYDRGIIKLEGEKAKGLIDALEAKFETNDEFAAAYRGIADVFCTKEAPVNCKITLDSKD